MRLLSDENCAEREFVTRLRLAGHDVETTVTALGAGASDATIVAYAIAQARAIVTKDADDFRRLLVERPEHSGVLLIYESQARRQPSVAMLARAIDNVAATDPVLESSIIVLNEFVW